MPDCMVWNAHGLLVLDKERHTQSVENAAPHKHLHTNSCQPLLQVADDECCGPSHPQVKRQRQNHLEGGLRQDCCGTNSKNAECPHDPQQPLTVLRLVCEKDRKN